MFKQKRSDPFAQYWAGDKAKDVEEQKKKKEEEDVGERDYVSPFRDEQEVLSAQRRRTQRFPTTSAASAYVNARPEELGYKKIGAGEKRAKDISFPVYLEEVEKKQLELLRELEGKEAHLRYLKDCQVVTEVKEPVKEEQKEEPKVEDEADEYEAEEQAEEDEGDNVGESKATAPETEAAPDFKPIVPNVSEPVVPAVSEPAKHEPEVSEPVVAADSEPVVATVSEPVVPAESEPAESEPAGREPEASEPVVTKTSLEVTTEVEPAEVSKPTAKTADEPEAEEVEGEKPVEDGIETPESPAKVEETEKTEKTEKPLPDPRSVPMVALPAAPRAFLDKIFKSPPAPVPNPPATPENPEHVVKTKDGYLTKVIYDKITLQDRQHNEWIAKYKKDEQQKFDDKRAESNRKINSLRAQIKEIKNEMAQLRSDTDAKIEVSENELTRKFFEMTQVHIQKKNQVFKDTEVIKSQKLSEKDSVLDKQGEVQKEIDDLNIEKEKVEEECQKWTKDIEELSARIDAKVADLEEINVKQKNTQEEISKLQQQKVDILDQIEKNNVTHAENEKVIEGAKNKTYLPKLNEVDNQISVLLGQLTTIRQHCANERTELSAITKKLDKERLEHEEKLKLEAENRRRKEEDLLGKQRKELEAKAQEAREKHEQEMQKLKTDYTQLEDKFKREQQQKKDALAFAHEPTKDDSLYEYGTEEEILTV